MSNLFDAQTKDVIESRMAQTLHTITEKEQSTIEGTFARDLIDANAVEFESNYAEMAMLRDAAFAETSWGDYLTLRAAEFGVDRKKAVKAKGEVTVTGMAGAYIIRSSLFQTKDGQRFYTLESATIPADATLRLLFPWKLPMPGRVAMWPKERLQKSPIPSRISRQSLTIRNAPMGRMKKRMTHSLPGSCSGCASLSPRAMPIIIVTGPCLSMASGTAKSSRSGRAMAR
jgi:hypothetical protein